MYLHTNVHDIVLFLCVLDARKLSYIMCYFYMSISSILYMFMCVYCANNDIHV